MVKKMANDLISRQAAIDWLTNEWDGMVTSVFDGIKNLPSADPEQRWIPCSERLPRSGRYLVSCSLSVFSPQVLNYDENNGEWFYDGCKSMDVEIPTINAWMPLPNCYQGDEK